MKCPKCQFENPESAKFCNGCGRKLELACPECGKVNPLGSRFCNECGQRLKEVEEAAQTIISALAKRAPTIFFLEDLHWADPSFIDSLRNTSPSSVVTAHWYI